MEENYSLLAYTARRIEMEGVARSAGEVSSFKSLRKVATVNDIKAQRGCNLLLDLDLQFRGWVGSIANGTQSKNLHVRQIAVLVLIGGFVLAGCRLSPADRQTGAVCGVPRVVARIAAGTEGTKTHLQETVLVPATLSTETAVSQSALPVQNPPVAPAVTPGIAAVVTPISQKPSQNKLPEAAVEVISDEFSGSTAAPVVMYTFRKAAAPEAPIASVAVSSGIVFRADAQGNALVKTYQ
ncbi:MAG: hypothetical protein K2W95_08815 [Candidatus Obscuribacterales bacterium]|nr:hypothetical protein [Candidatus Obscuribacterales bacterium]